MYECCCRSVESYNSYCLHKHGVSTYFFATIFIQCGEFSLKDMVNENVRYPKITLKQ